MHKWYVIQVISGQEKKVKKALEENRESKGMVEGIGEILVPTENVAEVKRGQQRVSEKRLWPGYILIKMDLYRRLVDVRQEYEWRARISRRRKANPSYPERGG